MTQELGKIDKPSSESFRGKRKLMLIPWLYQPPEDAVEGREIIGRYWKEISLQVDSLENGLGSVNHIFHETLTSSGDEALEYLDSVSPQCGEFVRRKIAAGAVLETTEDQEIFNETMDLQRCIMIPLQSHKVADQLRNWFDDGVHRRYEFISRKIDELMGSSEVGLLVINERHQVQFPSDVEVFYVAPPSLDEFRRWIERWISEKMSSVSGGQTSAESEIKD